MIYGLFDAIAIIKFDDIVDIDKIRVSNIVEILEINSDIMLMEMVELEPIESERR